MGIIMEEKEREIGLGATLGYALGRYGGFAACAYLGFQGAEFLITEFYPAMTALKRYSIDIASGLLVGYGANGLTTQLGMILGEKAEKVYGWSLDKIEKIGEKTLKLFGR
jgi:hypothetical protein